MATAILVIIYLAFIGLGLPDSLLGAAWPVAHGELGVPMSVAGVVSIVGSFGTVVSSLMAERMIFRFGTAKITAASILLTALALTGMGHVRSFYVVLLLAIPLGLGGGMVDTALNNYVALHYHATHMNFLHCFWGVGATASPLVMAAFLAKNDWRGAYRTIAIALAAIAIIVAASAPLWKKLALREGLIEAAGGDENDYEPQAPMKKRELLSKPGAVVFCLSFFAYCGAEAASGLWAASYFVTVKGLSADVAARYGSLFYMGIMIGRFFSGLASLRYNDRERIRAGECVILVGVLTMLLSPGGILQAVGLTLAGLGCAPIFPALVDDTPKLFSRRSSQGMIGLQFASAYLGATLLSPLFGWITPIVGLRAWPVYLLILYAIAVFSIETTYRRTKEAK